MKIRGNSVLITGGCGGIGMEMAQAFLAEGKRVILVDRAVARGEALAAGHIGVTCIRCDLADADDVVAALAPVFAHEDAPDILINNVGISPKFDKDGNRVTVWTMPLEDWEQVFATNVRSYFLCTKLALPRMIDRGYGRIINIASYAARTTGYQAATHYVASKAAVLGLTKSVAKEVTPLGINVNAINPGRIATVMTQDVSEDVNRALLDSIPARRLGRPDDIAKVAVFLASDLADYLTGTAIEVNGGLYLGP
jgi:3-oxoacyl-[acyl-carrier protein] reductase